MRIVRSEHFPTFNSTFRSRSGKYRILISRAFSRDSNARGELSLFATLFSLTCRYRCFAAVFFFCCFLLFFSLLLFFFFFFPRSQVSSARSRPILNFHHAGLPFLFVIGYPILINVSICFFVLALPFYCFPPHLAISRRRASADFYPSPSPLSPHPPSIPRVSILPADHGTDNEYSNFRRDSRGRLAASRDTKI